MTDFLDDHIKHALPKDAEWLFPSVVSKAGHVVAIKKPFKKAVVAAGLDPKRVVHHTLRHTVITHLVQAGVDLPTTARISGHRTLSMVLKYVHQNGNHIEVTMDKLQARMTAIAA